MDNGAVMLTSKTAEIVIKAILILVGLINFTPVLGVISAERLESMYAISLASNDLEILLRHRAVLFGIVGGFIICSAFRPVWRRLACVAGFASMISFIVVAYAVGGFGGRLDVVVTIDILAIAALLVGTALILKTGSDAR